MRARKQRKRMYARHRFRLYPEDLVATKRTTTVAAIAATAAVSSSEPTRALLTLPSASGVD